MSDPIRILFVGELHSSHARSWIELLSKFEDEFEIQGLHISSEQPPKANFPITDAKSSSFLQGPVLIKLAKLAKLAKFIFRKENLKIEPVDQGEDIIYGFAYSSNVRLTNGLMITNSLSVLKKFKPHIVHTLGIFPGSSFFLKVLADYEIGCDPVWIVQARGGPDISLNRKIPALANEIKNILSKCDYLIADNQQNYSYALQLGLVPRKIASTGPVPGTGGVDPSLFEGVLLPSKKERLILWPKAYNCIQSDGMVVLEALRLALPKIGKFRLIATASTPDLEYWFNDFLGSYGAQVEIHSRLPHEELLEIYRSARVLLAPSLSDGVPNSMYEAMASNTVPILSPLDTLLPLFVNKVNVIYAPNLDAQALADALVCAMNDDALADEIAISNRSLLPSLAGRSMVRERVINMYREVISSKSL